MAHVRPRVRGMAWTPLVVLLSLLLLPLAGLAQPEGGATYVGDAECLDCHDDVADAFASNIHMLNAETPGRVCESCHGPGSVHAEEGEAESMVNPATEYSAVAGNTCLDCHNGADFQSISSSAHHEVADGCSDCHAVHGTSENLLVAQGNDLCVDCHSDVAAQFRLPSHHPINEGLMDCSSCHNPHGDVNAFAVTNENREMCLSCHSAMEGPFVYEHDPVTEDCGICHTPHGSVANNLLVQNEPALCMNCHPMHFHTQVTGLDGDFTPPLFPDRGPVTSTLDAWKSGMLTKCTQCHSQVHGSDQPSQGITSGGAALTR